MEDRSRPAGAAAHERGDAAADRAAELNRQHAPHSVEEAKRRAAAAADRSAARGDTT